MNAERLFSEALTIFAEITPRDLHDTHIRGLYEHRPETTEGIIDRSFFSLICEIDDHLTEFRWHHPDFHITHFTRITLGVGIDILTGESDGKIRNSGYMDEIIF
jgi:hypothetical protein